MNRKKVLHKTQEYVQSTLGGEGTGHDWWHIHRVRNMALRLAEEEQADKFIVELAALLHDIADHKFHDGNEETGPETARNWLSQLDADNKTIDHVCEIIRDLSFKGAKVETPMKTMEGKVVQDADRLDALGAIGIARAFAYGGYKNRMLYDPGINPELHGSFEAYKNSQGPTLNHFYEKLFLLKDRMNTKTGKKIAEKRHEFMKKYVQRFLAEWEGKEV